MSFILVVYDGCLRRSSFFIINWGILSADSTKVAQGRPTSIFLKKVKSNCIKEKTHTRYNKGQLGYSMWPTSVLISLWNFFGSTTMLVLDVLSLSLHWYNNPAAETFYCLKFDRINYSTVPLIAFCYDCLWIKKIMFWLAEFLMAILSLESSVVICFCLTDYWSQVLCGSFGKRKRFLLCKIKGYRNSLPDSWSGESPGKSF